MQDIRREINQEIFIVTNRKLCKKNFIAQLAKWVAAQPTAIVLREKDLSEFDYLQLARKFLELCQQTQVRPILHQNWRLALEINAKEVHLSLADFIEMPKSDRAKIACGVSVHSLVEAEKAEALGAQYLFYGNIFLTDCKPGLTGRGICQLANLCRAVSIPVYAIGGVKPNNYPAIIEAKARGAAIMSSAMTCTEPQDLIEEFYANFI